ncbi:endosomal/lysosomal proton channel TMEM175 isoform X2 [Solea solea]|uniref:endosomal/lysosomal proton channel TMEM175 isoform X2 n=1 Tax=Solea solea TaxID=90069 RepID=UPI00272C099A|nr:endosomal/lysosomal proton channel TMEM175 isoform X2 [Solea solea]
MMEGREDSDVIEQQVEDNTEKSSRSLAGSSPSVSPAGGGRGPCSSSHRLLNYSDALLSIIATVMILPVAHTKMEDDELRQSFQLLLTTKIAVYLMTFLIVTVAWAAHIRLFQVIVHIDDCLALLNLACMMIITFLPYTFSLMASFPDNGVGLLLFCGSVMIIGLIQSGIVLYAFSRPVLLSDQIQMSENRSFYKHHILKVIMRVPIMCFFASVISFVFFQLSYALLAVVVFLPYISQGVKWCRSKAIGHVDESPDTMLFSRFLPSEALSKERVEAFSDGVYAIVATLLILDICEDNVPDPTTVKKTFGGSLVAALQVYGPQYLAYFGSFATVGLLWFVHHSLFLHVTRTTRLMGLMNTFSLAFVGGLPLAYQLTHEFPRNSRNELEAVQISCVIVFFAGIFQLSIFVVALFSQQETLHPHVRHGGREHVFMLAKLALYPCVALTTFVLTCFLTKFSASIFHLMEVTVPLAFLVLRLSVRLGLAALRHVFCPEALGPQSVLEDAVEDNVPFNTCDLMSNP